MASVPKVARRAGISWDMVDGSACLQLEQGPLARSSTGDQTRSAQVADRRKLGSEPFYDHARFRFGRAGRPGSDTTSASPGITCLHAGVDHLRAYRVSASTPQDRLTRVAGRRLPVALRGLRRQTPQDRGRLPGSARLPPRGAAMTGLSGWVVRRQTERSLCRERVAFPRAASTVPPVPLTATRYAA